MNRRALTLALVCSALAAAGLVACGDDQDETAPVDTTPIVGLFEIPISRNHQGTQPSSAAQIEISPDELRLDHTKVVDLERGRPADGEVSDHVITKLRQQLTTGASRSRASIKIHATVPYLTLVETLNTIESAGLGEVSFAVRNLAQPPQEGWMPIQNWQVVEDADAIEWESRPLPWNAFTEQWRPVYDACRAGRYIDCDFPYENVAEGGNLRMELWTRGQGMKVTFTQTDAPEPEQGGGGGGGVAMIEGVAPAAPAPAEGEEEEAPPATEGAFTVRHQEATQEESALSNLTQPVCGNQACQAIVVTDATAPSMRVISMIGAAFANGFTPPEVAFVIPESD